MKKQIYFFSLLAATMISFLGCAKQPQTTADVPRLISASHRVAVAPFSQPLAPSQLFTGQLPVPQGKIPADELLHLDRDLREILDSDSKRQFDFIPPEKAQVSSGVLSGQPAALQNWLAYGESKNLDYLLVPQVLDWHERQGSEAGVTSSASVRLEFFLISIPQKSLMGRSIYEEKQVGLIDNIFTVADFLKRKGRWVSAATLAKEGMRLAVKELGL